MATAAYPVIPSFFESLPEEIALQPTIRSRSRGDERSHCVPEEYPNVATRLPKVEKPTQLCINISGGGFHVIGGIVSCS